MSEQQEYRLPWIFTEGTYAILGDCLFCFASALVGDILVFLCFAVDPHWLDYLWLLLLGPPVSILLAVVGVWGLPLLLIQIGLLFYKLHDEIQLFHAFFSFCITQYLAGIVAMTQLRDFNWYDDWGTGIVLLVAFVLLVAAYIMTYSLYRKARKKLPKFQYATRRGRHRDGSRAYYDEDPRRSDGERTPAKSPDQQSEKDRVSQLKIPY